MVLKMEMRMRTLRTRYTLNGMHLGLQRILIALTSIPIWSRVMRLGRKLI